MEDFDGDLRICRVSLMAQKQKRFVHEKTMEKEAAEKEAMVTPSCN